MDPTRRCMTIVYSGHLWFRLPFGISHNRRSGIRHVIVYDEDNFKTKKTVNLNYKEFVNGHSYGSEIERWTGKITGIKNTANFKFYITYKTLADGKTYTDNNFDQNYNYNYIVSHG